MPRNTTQRDAIKKAFEESGHAMTATQVLMAAKKHLKTLSVPTVYREMRRLCRDNEVVAFFLPGQRVTYYEIAQEHHHHFICRQCKRLYGVECLTEHIRKLLPKGFILEDHDVQLYGLCPSCGGKRTQR